MILGPGGRKHFDLKYSKELWTVSVSGREEKKRRSEHLPLSQDRGGQRPPSPGGSAMAQARGICSQCTHIPPVLLLREKCGRLYCHTLKLDISGATGVHESPKEVKIQMDINVQ